MTIVRLKPDNIPNQYHGLIDELGIESARAQNLGYPITSVSRMKSNSDDILFLHDSDGFIRVGKRKLYLSNGSSQLEVKRPLCVLDFFVCKQRMGIGKSIFDTMLKSEQVGPGELAYDRPSDGMKKFLEKNYGLKSSMVQGNKYLIFSEFWN